MAKRQLEKRPGLHWKEEQETLTLEGEPVLEYRLCWPELIRCGLGGKWINRCYAYQAKCWQQRWQREIYWKACLDLAERRTKSKPFQTWNGVLKGEVTCWEDGILSIRMEGEEVRGDGKVNRVCWGDVWKVKEGAPLRTADLLEGGRNRIRLAVGQVVHQGRERMERGDWFPDADWETKVNRCFPKHDLYLTAGGVEAAFPQGSIAPSVEGTPVFLLQKQESLVQTGARKGEHKKRSK